MNKAERQQLADLRRDLARERAMRLSDPVPFCFPFPANEMKDGVKGWVCHQWGLDWRLEKAVSGPWGHAFGERAWENKVKYPAQGGRSLYSRPSLALRQARHELSIRCADALAKIDKEIADAEAEENSSNQ